MEMVSAKAIYYNNKNTEELMEIHPKEGPVSLQLFGSDPDIISEMARRIEEKPFSILDINMGCPVPKVVNNGNNPETPPDEYNSNPENPDGGDSGNGENTETPGGENTEETTGQAA